MPGFVRFQSLLLVGGLIALLAFGCPVPNRQTPPAITLFTINDGTAETTTRTVTLQIECTGAPTHLMVSESPDFADADWSPYEATSSFVLSEGAGEKTLYAKVRAGMRESSRKQASIVLTLSYELPWENVGPISGTVVLPSTVDDAKVLTFSDVADVAEDGGFSVPRSFDGRYLGIAVDQEKHPVLLGWLDAAYGDGQVISPTTTADVVLFFVLRGPMLPEPYWDDFRDAIQQSGLAEPLAAVIEERLEADPKAL